MMITKLRKDLIEKPYMGWILLFLACLISRIITSVNYFEDPDSLRFALGVADFDILNLQPHFPGYPVFVAFVKILYLLTGKLAFSFAVTGGVSMFLLIAGTVRLCESLELNLSRLLLMLFLFFNPLFWLMSNRFMPDLMGLAVLVWGLYFFTLNDKKSEMGFYFLTGLLGGVRLSYLPFLIIPVILNLYKRGISISKIFAGLIGVLIWFVPMILDTGLQNLLIAAQSQTGGHFYEWGGSVITNPGYIDRIYSFISGIWAHGFGFWWPERSFLTGIATLVFILAVITFFNQKNKIERFPIWLWLSLLMYVIWVFYFQNILYNPRHLMPVVLMLLVLSSMLFNKLKLFYSILFLAFYSITTIVLASQHKQESAIAQASEYLGNVVEKDDTIISTEVVNFYLDRTGVKGKKIDLLKEDVREVEGNTYVIGNFTLNNLNDPDSILMFYHNPYVNLIWPTIKVVKFENR